MLYCAVIQYLTELFAQKHEKPLIACSIMPNIASIFGKALSMNTIMEVDYSTVESQHFKTSKIHFPTICLLCQLGTSRHGEANGLASMVM